MHRVAVGGRRDHAYGDLHSLVGAVEQLCAPGRLRWWQDRLRRRQRRWEAFGGGSACWQLGTPAARGMGTLVPRTVATRVLRRVLGTLHVRRPGAAGQRVAKLRAARYRHGDAAASQVGIPAEPAAGDSGLAGAAEAAGSYSCWPWRGESPSPAGPARGGGLAAGRWAGGRGWRDAEPAAGSKDVAWQMPPKQARWRQWKRAALAAVTAAAAAACSSSCRASHSACSRDGTGGEPARLWQQRGVVLQGGQPSRHVHQGPRSRSPRVRGASASRAVSRQAYAS